MRPIKLALQLIAEGKHSRRQIARMCGASRPSVADYVTRMELAGLSWPLPADFDDASLEMLLFPPDAGQTTKFPQPDWQEIDKQMNSRKGGTLHVHHDEYLEQFPAGMKYTRFCQLYRKFQKARKSTIRFTYEPGSVTFVDYAGETFPIGPIGGTPEFEAQIFVGVLGSSGLVYAEATRSQQLADWFGSHRRMFESFGGTTRTLVCDNLKSAVTTPSRRGEPEIQRDYLEMGLHYGVNIVPARPRHPRDKGKVEQAVQMVGRTVLYVLRNGEYTNLAEFNLAIFRCVAALNAKTLRREKTTRQELFASTERTALQALPTPPWEYATYHLFRVGLDYHVEFKNHSYSVPYALCGEQVEVRATAGIIDISHKGKHVACHARAYIPGHTTCANHLDPKHKIFSEWQPEEALQSAELIGPSCAALLAKMFAKDTHIHHQMGALNAIRGMARDYTPGRLEIACEHALAVDAHDEKRFVRNLLRSHREGLLKTGTDDTGIIREHANLRSPSEFTLHIVKGGSKE